MTTVLGVDPSLACTGLSVAKDGVILDIFSTSFPGIEHPADKREALMHLVHYLCELYTVDYVISERIGQFRTAVRKGRKGVLYSNTDTITELSALVKFVVSGAWVWDEEQQKKRIPVYTVDTRSWKSRVVGSAKATKDETIEFIFKLLQEHEPHIQLNADKADAGAISLYAFVEKPLLKREM